MTAARKSARFDSGDAGKGEDVVETDFHSLWYHLVEDNTSRDGSRFVKWFRLCELILNECQDLLEELAPAGSEWKTLREYLHCPTYTLKLVKVGADEKVATHPVDGPADKAAFDLLPVHVNKMSDFVKDLQTCASVNLLPGLWYRHSSLHMRGPDGRMCTLVPCEHSALDAQRGEPYAASWDLIRAYVHLANLGADTYAVPRLSSLVTDEGMVAGVLIDYTDCRCTVHELVEAAVSSEQLLSLEHRLALWRDRITLTVTTLHEHGITLTTPEFGSTIREENMEVDQHDQVWLSLSFGTVSVVVGQDELEHQKSDMDELRAVFDERLPNRVIEARSRSTPAWQ
ncbi:hypothetical protein LTR10_003861 [Elasticomyces elasticus]|nr:hypothetical protein LTR10_003861 [Elasticomyces elasticus]KAK4977953.1 hypothetical protein LTR42_002328 [Elasticomyces elasticus]